MAALCWSKKREQQIKQTKTVKPYKDELAWQDSPAIFNQIRQYLVDAIFRIHFCLLLNEVELSFTKRKLYVNFLNNCHGNRDRPVAKWSFSVQTAVTSVSCG